tara:strand:- start:255 stop:755 length:501 start_codon:yes stop_codon:yes gene_type:complete
MNKPLSREYLLKQGRCCNNGCTNCPYKENNMKFRSIISKKYKVKLKDLTSIWNTEGRYDYAEKWPEYDWKSLEDSLRKKGLQSEKREDNIKAHKSFLFRKNKYYIYDGNHRVEILKSIGEIDEIEITLTYRYAMVFLYLFILLLTPPILLYKYVTGTNKRKKYETR